MKVKNIHIAILLFVGLFPLALKAQFYNGYNMSFGKNRVQYRSFEWHYIPSEHYNTYYYNGGEALAQFTNKIVAQKIEEYERFFEFHPNQKFIFLVYNNQSDFKQSNVGYASSNSEYNIGGSTQISKNKAYLFFQDNYKHFEEQISEAVAELMLNQLLYGESLYQQVSSSTLLSMPLWYTKSLVRYLASGWNLALDSKVKDAILSGEFEYFNRLDEQQAELAGLSLWHYIALTFGKESIPNIIYLAHLSKSIESAYQFVLGMSFKDLQKESLDYYHEQYEKDNAKRSNFKPEESIRKTKKARIYQQLVLSKDEKKIAYTSNEKGRYIVWIHDLETGKTKSVIRKSHRLNQITDYSYPLLAWHPSNKKLIFVTEEEGGFRLNAYDLEEKKIQKEKIFFFTKINSIGFSDDGQWLLFTANKKGQSDIFTYNFITRTHKAVTSDKAEEQDARFVEKTSSIVFASNRASNKLKCDLVQEQYDIFLYKDGQEDLYQLTQTPKLNEHSIQKISNRHFLYLDGQSGVDNLSLLQFDSSISFVDTLVHYRYFAHKKKLSNQAYNILSYQYKAPYLYKIQHIKGQDRLLKQNLNINRQSAHIPNTAWRKHEQYRHQQDSIYQWRKDSLEKIVIDYPDVDTNYLDYNNYIFDISKAEIEKNKPAQKDSTPKAPSKYYFTQFYHQNLQTQIDFGFLNQSYQTFSGSGVYYNPGLNILTKWSINDLFENYRFTIGTRLTANIKSGEWLFLLEDLSKRLDKQYVYHRQSFEDISKNTFRKTISNQLMYILKYPFNQVSSLKATLEYRLDKGVYKSIDRSSLHLPNEINNWLGIKLEYVFDNSLPLGTNLYRGWRNKIFAEAYQQIGNGYKNLYVLGFDFRHYLKIHRSFIFASRLAGSSSFGQSKLIYYLGSTDNWLNLSSQTEVFDQSVKINRDMNWAFQALATNMRGFSQNVRNGSTFAVLNNELRLPVVRYFSKTPISSSFLYNLQLIGFFDVGTAFSGSSPYSDLNKYNSTDHKDSDYPVSIVIDNQKQPFVFGYGFGVRSKLFGYFIRADYAWGIDGDVVLPRIFYLSLSLDF